jgi:hypothetical protein
LSQFAPHAATCSQKGKTDFTTKAMKVAKKYFARKGVVRAPHHPE